MSKYWVRPLVDDTYQVVFKGNTEFQGSLADCEAYIRLSEGGYMSYGPPSDDNEDG